MGLSKTQRNLISRGTLLCVGAMLVIGGWRVVAKGTEFRNEWRDRQQILRDNGMTANGRDSSGAAQLWLFGIVLIAAGTATTGLAVVPTEWLSWISVAPKSGQAFNDRWKSEGGGW